MNIFFSKDRMEEQLVAHVRKAMSTTSLMQTIQTVLAHSRTQQLVRQYLDHILHYTKEGMMLSMLGVQREALEPLLMPAIVSTFSDLAPIVAEILEPADIMTPEAFLDAMERVVSHRTASLDVDDLKGIVSGVLAPHLSILVLWGSLFGIVVGVFAEVFTFSHFLSGCVSN
ncbi:transmembrane protein, putative [Bodo saltans]|uniref:Transmembrane protein, putative n=1 Tax=Bodo saltans TaxID=75058 RepID=A0A0S4JJT0_BODSA|nr:transmembrane protein, putative [Bodo saltans]|eukprot:CUG90180.1 transmembrane protein, putative [Bodo saltans]